MFSNAFWPPGERCGSLRPAGATTRPKSKRGHRGHFHDPLRGPEGSQMSSPAGLLLLELLQFFFYPGERGGAAFGSSTLPPQLNSGQGRKGPLPCPPQVSAAPTRCRSLVDCCMCFFLPFPWPRSAGRQSKAARRGRPAPKNLRRPFRSSLPSTALPGG